MKKLIYFLLFTGALTIPQTCILSADDSDRRKKDFERDFGDALRDPAIIEKEIKEKEEKERKRLIDEAEKREREGFFNSPDGKRFLQQRARDRIAGEFELDEEQQKLRDEGRKQAQLEKYRKSFGPTFIQKIPNAITDGLLGAVSSLTREIGVTVSLLLYKEAKKALTTKPLSPEELKEQEEEKKYDAEMKKLKKEIKQKTKRIEVIQTYLAVREMDALQAKIEKDYEEYKKKKDAEAKSQASATITTTQKPPTQTPPAK